ncbi:MAG: molybdopterin cofactor-binding domain-containing protein [Pseudomonadota bacterium]
MSTPTASLPPTLNANRRLDRWLRINADGTVTVRTGKVEIGQGIVSAMAQIAADELDVDYTRIRMVPADTSVSPDEGSTTGSRSIEEGGSALRQVCAEVRDLLLQTAARRLNAGLESLTVKDGTIRVRARRESATYWELAAEIDLAREATGQVSPKQSGELELVGKTVPRLDIPRKLTGAAFIHDLEFPGMLHGRVLRPPSYRATLISLDAAAARVMPGVEAVVREGNFVGVVAAREEQVIKAMQALARSAVWDEQADLPDADAMPEFLRAQPAEDELLREKSSESTRGGKALVSTYTRPYLAHASIGPSCAVAWWHENQLDVWSHSQAIHALRAELAKTLQLDAANIVVRHAEGAGCYGHNGADDAALDAVLLARAVAGRPVRLQWMREDEFGWEPFGPAMVVRMEGTLDPNGKVANWQEEIWSNRHITRPGRHPNPGLLAAWHIDPGVEPPPAIDMPLAMGGGSQRNALPYYDFPNERIVNHAVRPMPLRVSTLRALGAHLNVFAIESFMDELAEAAGIDPVEFRLRHLKDERARAVIETAAAHAHWKPGMKGDGTRGMGIGFARYKNIGNYVAVVAEVIVEQDVRVPRVVAAVDCGRVVNPDGVTNQAEGGIVQAASWTLKEQVRFDRTRITSRTWEDYPVITFSEAPRIETVLIDRPDEPSLGVGEGMVGPTAAAIGNAVADAVEKECLALLAALSAGRG